ncbi:MAG: hypothetical protein WAX77_14885 [Methylococcaceae bacterium]
MAKVKVITIIAIAKNSHIFRHVLLFKEKNTNVMKIILIHKTKKLFIGNVFNKKCRKNKPNQETIAIISIIIKFELNSNKLFIVVIPILARQNLAPVKFAPEKLTPRKSQSEKSAPVKSWFLNKLKSCFLNELPLKNLRKTTTK